MKQVPLSKPATTSHLEDWLAILVNTYAHNPSSGLAKVITYYIDRILKQNSPCIGPIVRCQYISMRKFWLWQSQNK